MGLKDKAKGIWKRVTDLDDESDIQNSSSKDKERIPYKDISKKLKDLMKKNVDVVGRKIIIPSYYIIYFNENDRKMRIEVEDVVCEELKEELYHDIRKISPEFNKKELFITVDTDVDLEDGQFRIGYHIKKPDESNKVVEEPTPIQTQEIDNDTDFQQTVIEQAPQPIPDEEKTVIMQRPSAFVFYTLLVDSGDEKQEIKISKDTISIGRGNKDDVKLESTDFSISRSHALLAIRDENFYLTPYGINGTLLNEQELELNREVQIAAGDEIKIMNYTLKIIP